MAESFDWRSIELPKGIDYDQLYDQLMVEPKLLDKMVEEMIQNDPKLIQKLTQSKELTENKEQIKSLIKQIEDNNKMFDQMMEEYHKSIINAKYLTDL